MINRRHLLLAAAASFTYQNTQVCFFGHTHVPVAFIRDSGVRGGTYSKFKVEAGRKYFVNVGAVGQPLAVGRDEAVVVGGRGREAGHGD